MTMKTIAQLFDLGGKGAVVTGGAMGIGQGIAFRLAEAGAGVMVADLDLKAATQTAQQIEARGGKAKAIRADVRSAADAGKVAQATVDAFGSLDILVNAVAPGGIITPGAIAASPSMQKALDMTEAEILPTHLARVPLNKLGEPDDIGKVVLFLVSEAADFVTGTMISADAGFLVT